MMSADRCEPPAQACDLVEILARKWAAKYRPKNVVGEDDWQAYAPIIRDALSVADNHHNALACPYCNPEGLKFAPVPSPAAVAALVEIATKMRQAADTLYMNRHAGRQLREWSVKNVTDLSNALDVALSAFPQPKDTDNAV